MPIVWFFIPIPFLIAGSIYISGIQTDAKVLDARVMLVEKKADILQESLTVELRHLNDKMDTILSYHLKR